MALICIITATFLDVLNMQVTHGVNKLAMM